MPHENAEYTAVVYQMVSTSKEISESLEEKISQRPELTEVTLGLTETKAIATQLRVTANLIAGLLEENATMMVRIAELVDRVHKDKN